MLHVFRDNHILLVASASDMYALTNNVESSTASILAKFGPSWDEGDIGPL